MTQANGENPQKHQNLRSKAEALLQLRQKLPIWSQAEIIRSALRSKDILLLIGETGSGKSTQLPQFLLDEPWCKTTQRGELGKVGGCIAITEPRRVAAITLARRVAEELGSPLGSSSPASKVGYSVRFDNSTSPCTRIKFLTEGMLLQEMLIDPWLRKYSAVVVDEVHERSINVDLILGFMRQMLVSDRSGRGGVPLKVIVMSATADTKALLQLFEGNGDSQEADPEWNGFSDDESQNGCDLEISSPLHLISIPGRHFPVQTIYNTKPVDDYVHAASETVFRIHYKEPLPGDVLVFLPGQEIIQSLEDVLNQYALGLSRELPKLLVLPLFSALPQTAQDLVFQSTPPRTRKVILSTNIAETSVTVPGVHYVIDCGKSKTKQFRAGLGLESLLVKPVSKSSAIQRQGRAGREGPGKCYRLYTEDGYRSLMDATTPEMLRCDLAKAILTMKARGVDDLFKFPFLDRPPRNSLEAALLQLLQIGALEETGRINEVGLKIAKLPLSAPLGRVLVAAMDEDNDCLPEVVDIVSCLSVENIFPNLNTEEDRERAEAARRSLLRREGDHLTLLTTVQAYATENADRKAWAEKHFVAHRAMRSVMVGPNHNTRCSLTL